MPDAAPPAPVTTAHYTANIRNQMITTLASNSLPAAGTEGRVYAVTDRDRLEIDTGTVLTPGPSWGAAGRVGFSVTRAASQSIPTGTGTFTAISWTAEPTDTDGFIAVTASTATIPANLGGLYDGICRVSWATSPGANSSIELLVGSTAFRTPVGAGVQMTDCSITIAGMALVAGDVISIRLSQGAAGAINVTGAWQMWRRYA